MVVEPLAGKRQVTVTDRRTAADFAAQMRTLCDDLYPQADVIRVVLDNRNTHAYGSLFAAFPPDEAWRRRKLEFHHTPKHASWRNMAECEWSAVAGPCLDRRIPSREELAAEVKAWVAIRNAAEARINWAFRVADARKKLAHLYPQNPPRCPTSGRRREFRTVDPGGAILPPGGPGRITRHVARLTDDPRADLVERLAGRLTLRARNRIPVRLRGDGGDTDEEVADALDVGVATAAVRKRFATEGLGAALAERPRSGGPAALDGKVGATVVARAGSPTPDGRADTARPSSSPAGGPSGTWSKAPPSGRWVASSRTSARAVAGGVVVPARRGGRGVRRGRGGRARTVRRGG